MPVPNRHAVLVLASVLGLVPGCTVRQGLDPSSTAKQWALVRMELDRANLPNRGTLPVYDRPTGGEFGMLPRASGILRTTDGGKTLVRVQIDEPVVNYTGRADFLHYEIVNFFGTRTGSGEKIEIGDDRGSGMPLGSPTVLHVQDLGNHQLRVQGATGDRLLPYVYIFEASPQPPGYVSVPYKN